MQSFEKENGSLQSKRPSIVFDLDETLIHRVMSVDSLTSLSNGFSITVNKKQVNIIVRGGVEKLMEKLQESYDIFIFTSAKKEYADQIIDRIAPFVPKSRRFYHDSVKFCKQCPFKDLTLISQNLDQTLLIDDCPKCGLRQPSNIVVVKKWTGNVEDVVLTNELLPLLLSIANEANLPKSIREQSLLQSTKNISFWKYH